jgi:hypothetical protein
VHLSIAAVFALGMFVVFAIRADGLRVTNSKTTFNAKTGSSKAGVTLVWSATPQGR